MEFTSINENNFFNDISLSELKQLTNEVSIKTRYYRNEYYEYNDMILLVMIRKRDNKRTIASIDKQDYDRVSKHIWYPHRDKRKPEHSIYCLSKGGLRLHRFIINNFNITDQIIDHIDRNPLNNRRSNLRVVNILINNNNMSISRNNSSGIIGVRFRTERNKWESRILFEDKIVTKLFNTKEEAIEHRKKMEKLKQKLILKGIYMNSTTIPEMEVKP